MTRYLINLNRCEGPEALAELYEGKLLMLFDDRDAIIEIPSDKSDAFRACCQDFEMPIKGVMRTFSEFADS